MRRLRGNRNDFTALTFVKSTCCRTQATSLQGLIPNHHSNTNKKCPNWDIFHWWRMVRDCNSHELRSRAPFTARTVCACSEPGNFVAVSNPMPITIKIKHPKGCLIFMADGERFEPPDELPRQRFSRPSPSTALPTILELSKHSLYFTTTKVKSFFPKPIKNACSGG